MRHPGRLSKILGEKMECSETRRLADRDWPLYPEASSAELCCYEVTANGAEDAARVVADAEAQPDYDSHSEFDEVPPNKIHFYVYFNKQC
jgi:hypothetical protein